MPTPQPSSTPSAVFDLADVLSQAGETWQELLRVTDLSLGIYSLQPGEVDRQDPHNEDEIYLVLAGRATLEIAGADHPATEGSVFYVAKHVEHRFHSIGERLQVLVLFAPAESSVTTP